MKQTIADRYIRHMPEPSQIAGNNLPGLLALLIVVGIVLLPVLLSRGGQRPSSDHDAGEDGGNGPRRPHDRPDAPVGGGGIPLDDADPARRRLRDHHGRSIGGRRTVHRRPAREPKRSPVDH
jgi:hypothetical protein